MLGEMVEKTQRSKNKPGNNRSNLMRSTSRDKVVNREDNELNTRLKDNGNKPIPTQISGYQDLNDTSTIKEIS